MENVPHLTVEPPDSRGLRQVSSDGEIIGAAWSPRGLRSILRRLGYPKGVNVEDATFIRWRGGDSRVWPDHSVKRHITIGLMTVGLLGSMALHMIVGMPDALRGLTFAGRITGFLFVIAGAIQGLAVLAVYDYWGKRHARFSGAVVLLGTLIALATQSLLMFLWLQEREYTPYLLAYLPLWCWSLWALLLLVREKTWSGIPHPKKFAAGVTATVVIATANLAYSSVYQPASQPMLVNLEAKFGKPAMDSRTSFVELPLTLRARNDGKVPAYVISDDYSVYGDVVNLAKASSGLKDTKDAMIDESDAARYTDEPETETINAGRFLSPGWELDPGEEYTAEKMVRVPKEVKYDALQVYFSLTLMRADRGRVNVWELENPHHSWEKGEGNFYCPDCEKGLIYQSEIWHNNNFINVTRRPRYVTAWWSATSEDSSSSVSISSSPFRSKWKIDEKESEREMDRYGAVSLYAEAMIPFAAVLGEER
ncbi:Yip1 family protein [Streptomyces sp. NPDC001500]